MKKEYIKPEIITVNILPESMLALSNPSEGMGSNETPGGQDAFNANERHSGSWGNLWD